MTRLTPSQRSGRLQAGILLIQAADRSALLEVERALNAQLHPVPSARDLRLARLGPLAAMLHQLRPATLTPEHRRELPAISAEDYNQRRPRDAPHSDQLTGWFGSWTGACHAAFGLLPDGRYVGLSKPWLSPSRGQQRIYRSDQQAISDVRACALTLGIIPTADDYGRWQRARAHRLPGQPWRAPVTWRTIQRRLGNWPQALQAARITDGDLAEARRRWLNPSYDSHDDAGWRQAALALTNDQWQALGFDEQDVRRLLAEGPWQLQLSSALRLASALGGSLDWLAGHSPGRGHPRATLADASRAEDVQMDSAVVRDSLERAGVNVEDACARMNIGRSLWLKLMNGRDEPTVGELDALAMITDVTPEALLTPPARPSTNG